MPARRRRLAPWIAPLALAVGGALPGSADATPTTLACSESALAAAVAAGGEYGYAADCTLVLPNAFAGYTLPVGRSLSIDAQGHAVSLAGPNALYATIRTGFMTVEGTLTLRGLTLQSFSRVGVDGTNGTPGTNGGPGIGGGPGGPGGNGTSVEGGALTISPTGRVTLSQVTLTGNLANAGDAGDGGDGGTGGTGTTGPSGSSGATGVAGGNGGAGGRGGNGGQSGDGGDARGGAIFNAGTLVISDSTLSYNEVAGGQGGFSNDGGTGGDGGAGGHGGSGTAGPGGSGGAAGPGGRGGDGGRPGYNGYARGGAIYNAGTLVVTNTAFRQNRARGGNSQAGGGGDGGRGFVGGSWGFGSPPGATGASAAGGDGGDAGAPGPGGTSEGGAIYSTAPFTGDGLTPTGNAVLPEDSAYRAGGDGGTGFPNGAHGTPLTAPYLGVPGVTRYPDFFPSPGTGAAALSVGDAAVVEPDEGSENARFSVELAPPSTDPVTVDYATADGTATAAAGDYAPRSGTLTFAPGETVKPVDVPVLHDDADEGDETFTLALASESGATVARRVGTATIGGRHRISGTLIDRKGRPIAGATVTVEGIEHRTLTTDAAGAYTTRVLPATYTVTPVAPPPGQPEDGVFEPREGDDCIPLDATCFVRATKDVVAGFRYVFKVPLRGTITDPVGRGMDEIPVRITGTDETGKAVDVRVLTDEQGRYSRPLVPGVYAAAPQTPEGTKATLSFVPGACDGTKRPAACTVTIDREPRTADFTSECEQTVSFQTSMVAKGCLIRLDAKGKTFKAKGPVRINGVDFQAEQDKQPITFDTGKKLVSGTDVLVWVSRGSDDKKWLSYHLDSLTQTFPGRTVRYTLALGKAAGGWNPLTGTANATLFGFPAHAPAFELESTAGRTTMTLQLSTPPKDGAILDPQSGLWKAPNDSGQLRVAYPNVVRGTVALTNDNGIQTVEGSFSPSAIYSFGATSKNGVFGRSISAFPVKGQVQLARVGVKRDFANDVWRFSGTVVSHWRPGAKAPLPPVLSNAILQRIGTNAGGEGFLSALVFDFELGLKLSGGGAVAGIVDRAALRANGINRMVLPYTYLQRLGLDMGRDTDAAKTPLKLQLTGALTLGPRIRSDVWFQELLSLDVDAGLYIPSDTYDLTVAGNAVLRAANARLINGRVVWNIMGGSAEITGEAAMNLRDFIRKVPLGLGDISFLGTGKLSIPAAGSWTLSGDGQITLFGHTGAGTFRWTKDVLGVCLANGWGLSYDGAVHASTSCGFDGFGAAPRPRRAAGPRAAANIPGGAQAADAPDGAFAVASGTPAIAVEVAGSGAAPLVAVDGPDGLHVASPSDRIGAATDATAILRDPRSATTYVVLTTPAAGAYRVSALPGSSAIRSVRTAQKAAPPKVTATVRVRRCRATVRWRMTPRSGQRVHLQETGSSGSREIAVVTTARGSRTFTPRPGGDTKRTLTAIVEQDRLPRAQLSLGRYRVPSARAARVTGLRGRLTGRRLTASWKGGCASPRSLVQAVVGGKTTLKVVRTPRVSLTVRKATSAALSVWAISGTGGTARAATRTVRATR